MLTDPHVSVNTDGLLIVAVEETELVTLSVGDMVSGVNPLGPVMVHEDGGVRTFQVKVTGVATPLRARTGKTLKVTNVGSGAPITIDCEPEPDGQLS